MGKRKKNFQRFVKFEIDDGTLFKPEPPKFKQKGVVEVLQLQGLGVTENSWRLEKRVAFVSRRNGEQVLLQRLLSEVHHIVKTSSFSRDKTDETTL